MTLLALKAMGSGIAQLLNKEGVLRVDLRAPNRDEHIGLEKDLEDGVDGFILDINLSDQVGADGKRFVGTGAGLAQDLRLQQALFPDSGQRPRPVVRLCAEQVFQHYLQGDNSTADIFDLGFSKETIADIATEARAQIASLPDLYRHLTEVSGTEAPSNAAADLVGLKLDEYLKLHSRFRAAWSKR